MARKMVMVMMVMMPAGAMALVVDDERIMRRGDANNDGMVQMSDAIFINNWLYSGGPQPPCMNQADANDDGLVTAADATFILNWIYKHTAPPPSPGPFNQVCTVDLAPRPGCMSSCD
jgi:hypothetical protein